MGKSVRICQSVCYVYIVINAQRVNDYNLIGEYICKLDAKGRLRLPTALIRQLPHSGVLEFAINRGFEKHLMVYPKDVWGKKTKKINQLNIYNTNERQAIRYFYRGASMIHMDSADRILIPSALISYAGLEKEVVLFAYDEQIELWDKVAYDEMLNQQPNSFDQIADKIFGNGGALDGSAQTDGHE